MRPTDAIVALRAYLRHRQTLIESAGAHIQRMQKALVQMTVQWPWVVSDITGVTGLRILRAIVAGRRDPVQLAAHRDHRCRASKTEIGTDMDRWPTEKHVTSWLTLAPKHKISGGRLLSSRTQPSANRAAAILPMTAMCLGRTQTALGTFSRRLAARIGKPQAITATARKLALLIYRALKGELVYRDPGANAYDAQQQARVLRRLRQRAATLGFELVSRETGEILDGVVS